MIAGMFDFELWSIRRHEQQSCLRLLLPAAHSVPIVPSNKTLL